MKPYYGSLHEMRAFKRITSLLALHWGALLGVRSALVTAAFVFVLFVTAIAFVIGLRDLNRALSAAWLSLLPSVYVLYFIVTAKDEDRRDAFCALGFSRAYDLTQASVMMVALLPIELFWCGTSLYLGGTLEKAFIQLLVMILFSSASLGALISARRLVSPYRLPQHLYVLISGPWNLISMLFALSATESVVRNESCSVQLLALGFMTAWWGVQTAISREG